MVAQECRLKKMQGAKKPVRRGCGIQMPGGENGLYRGSERAKKGIKIPPGFSGGYRCIEMGRLLSPC